MKPVKKIEELYAFVTLDDQDNVEGIMAFLGPDGTMMPMVGADLEMIEKLRPQAELLSSIFPHPVEIRVWRGPYEVVDTIGSEKSSLDLDPDDAPPGWVDPELWCDEAD